MQNRIGDRGCAALCAVLHETRIALLNLSSNLLGPRLGLGVTAPNPRLLSLIRLTRSLA